MADRSSVNTPPAQIHKWFFVALTTNSPRPRSFLAAGINDTPVNPQGNTVQMADKLKAAGVPVTLKLDPRASHTTMIGTFVWLVYWIAAVLDDVRVFIDATPPSSPTTPTPPNPQVGQG